MADIEVKRVPRIDVIDNGTPAGTRPAINLIDGTNVTLTITDDPGNNRVNVQIDAAGGSGSPAGSDTEVQYNNGGSFGASAAFTWLDASSTVQLDGTIKGLSATSGGNTGGTSSLQFTAASADGSGGTSGTAFILIGAAGSGSNSSGTLEYSMGAGGAFTDEVGSNYFTLLAGGASNGTCSIGAALFSMEQSYATSDNTFINGFKWTLESPSIGDGVSATATGIKVELTAPEIDTGTPTNGNLVITNLPSSDPGIPGALWVDGSNFLKVST